ncbi:MAG: hypothetical protein EXR45_07690 [Chloroflexi bacterium]|nr:hypothetical protein [Chloroflexota bacterium]
MATGENLHATGAVHQPAAGSGAHVRVFNGGKSPTDPFTMLAARLRDDPAWTYHELETGHTLHYTAPDDTVAILAGIGDAQDRGV